MSWFVARDTSIFICSADSCVTDVLWGHPNRTHSPGEGEGVLLGILGGGVPPRSQSPDPISDPKMSFSTPVFRPDL